jgi:hypothetical protein
VPFKQQVISKKLPEEKCSTLEEHNKAPQRKRRVANSGESEQQAAPRTRKTANTDQLEG